MIVVRKGVILTVALAVVGAGCSARSFDEEVNAQSIPPSTFRSSGTQQTNSKLKGIRYVDEDRNEEQDFVQQLLRIAPDLANSRGAAIAYDAVVMTALAAEDARSDMPGRIAAKLPSTVDRGASCDSYQRCMQYVHRAAEYDYDGKSSLTILDNAGTLNAARFSVMEIGATGTPTRVGELAAAIDSNGETNLDFDPFTGPLGDGVVTVGLLLSTSPAWTDLSAAATAGARLAAQDIADTVQPLGEDVRIVIADSKSGSSEDIEAALSKLSAERVDVVLGGLDESVDVQVAPRLLMGGTVMIGAFNPGQYALGLNDFGRYFRINPTAELVDRAIASAVARDGYSSIAILSSASDSARDVDVLTVALRASELKVAVQSRKLDPSGDPAAMNLVLADLISQGVQGAVILGDEALVEFTVNGLWAAGQTPAKFGLYALRTSLTPQLSDRVGSAN